ncbi:MAG: glycosyltransferase family 4 protein [Candidatus Delongbacteria bacterium]|nr:glycosyltransferase family 4 protein [Candidatus Delongbacteria bacterium]
MKVSILTLACFPEGMATTNRVVYHAKGLKENGVDVDIIAVKPTEKYCTASTTKNTIRSGEVKGVKFKYSVKSPIRSKYFIKRRIDDIFGPIYAAHTVVKNKCDAAMLISSNSFYHVMLFKLVFNFFRIKFIVERAELPFHGKKQHGIYKLKNYLYSKFIYKNLYGFLAISEYLYDHYSKMTSKKTKMLLHPVIIDEKDIYRSEVPRTRNLVYTGPLYQIKDGIVTIIKAFNLIAKEFPETDLLLTGNIDNTPDKEAINKAVEEGGVKDRIVFKGFISRQEMIELLNSAAGLVLAKPSSEQADSCFPTKLGEYLSTSNPIVITNTGEISLYLTNGVDAYIAEPDSVESFANKIIELLSYPDKAKKIGEAGRNAALKNFNYLELAKNVIDLIKG